jgi:hypothetical protein
MLCSLLLKELTIPVPGDNLHHIILGYWLVEYVSEGFADD